MRHEVTGLGPSHPPHHPVGGGSEEGGKQRQSGHPTNFQRKCQLISGRDIEEYGKINISIITYYEIVSGLEYKDAKKQLEAFLEFARQNTIIPVTQDSATISAEIYAQLRKTGRPLDDIDLLIAGIAISNGFVLATNNESHFTRIAGLEIENWNKS